MQGIGQDIRLAFRTLWATRTVSILAACSLALGIGGTTAIFSVVDALLLEKLPVVEPDRLAVLSSPTPLVQGRVAGWANPTWEQIRARRDRFDGVGAASLQQQFNLAREGEAERVDGLYVSGELLNTLGVPSVIGRTFTFRDDVRGGGTDGAVAMISYGLWQRRFGGAPSVIGSEITIERVPFTIIGVTPPNFFGTEVGQTFDVMIPIGTEILIRGKDTLLDGRGNWLRIMIRLGRGQSPESATTMLRSLQPEIREAALPADMPAQLRPDFLKEPFIVVPAAAGTSQLRQRYERPLMTIFVVTVLVLLVACGNIANLLLARGAARHMDMSMRLALGAARWRVVRLIVVESLVLGGLGAAAGLVVAAIGSRVLVAQLSTYFDHVFLPVSTDGTVLAFTVVVSLIATVLFGALPALRVTRIPAIEAIREQGRGGSSGHARLSSAAVVAQVALSLVLVVAAGLFVRTFAHLARLPLGFDQDRVLIAYTDAVRAEVDPANRVTFAYELIAAVSAVPGVADAAISMVTPVSGLSMSTPVTVPGAPEMPQGERTALMNYVTSGWFATYRTPLLAGRDISRQDSNTAPPVLVVNEAFVRRFFPNESPIGRTVIDSRVDERGQLPVQKTIIGVVANASYRSMREPMQPTVYAPIAQLRTVPPSFSISIAADGRPASALASAVSAALRRVNANVTFSFLPLRDQVEASLAQERLIAILSGFFGVLALLLAGLGLYGVTSYAVVRRRVEIAIRMAIGATPRSVVWLALSRVVASVTIGIGIGVLIALWLSRFVGGLVYGMPARDGATIVGAGVILAAVGLLAGWFPARRASRTEPGAVMR